MENLKLNLNIQKDKFFIQCPVCGSDKFERLPQEWVDGIKLFVFRCINKHVFTKRIK